MPRKLRLEFPNAIYHVINRGNYRLNAWIAANLNMGQASSVSAFVSRVRNGEMNNEIEPVEYKVSGLTPSNSSLRIHRQSADVALRVRSWGSALPEAAINAALRAAH
jgi:hypothetical protein